MLAEAVVPDAMARGDGKSSSKSCRVSPMRMAPGLAERCPPGQPQPARILWSQDGARMSAGTAVFRYAAGAPGISYAFARLTDRISSTSIADAASPAPS